MNRLKDTLYFDIETGACEESMRRNPFDPNKVSFGNTKDPEKREAKVAEARKSHSSKAALDAHQGQVLAIGYSINGERSISCQQIPNTEKALLISFWGYVGDHLMAQKPVAGWNILKFDIPFLMQRSRLHGITIPSHIYSMQGKWPTWHTKLYDLMVMEAFGERENFKSLDYVARFYGVGNKPRNVSGADFARLFHGTEEQRAQALGYLKNDLAMLEGVGERILQYV